VNIAHSKLTSQGQISVPAEVRRKLGVGPGAVLEWVEEAGRVVVRKAGRFSSADVHQALFGARKPSSATPANVEEGIRQYVRRRHARG
jgi:AbrB family looped-hinge helix DNA binding protein